MRSMSNVLTTFPEAHSLLDAAPELELQPLSKAATSRVNHHNHCVEWWQLHKWRTHSFPFFSEWGS